MPHFNWRNIIIFILHRLDRQYGPVNGLIWMTGLKDLIRSAIFLTRSFLLYPESAEKGHYSPQIIQPITFGGRGRYLPPIFNLNDTKLPTKKKQQSLLNLRRHRSNSGIYQNLLKDVGVVKLCLCAWPRVSPKRNHYGSGSRCQCFVLEGLIFW